CKVRRSVPLHGLDQVDTVLRCIYGEKFHGSGIGLLRFPVQQVKGSGNLTGGELEPGITVTAPATGDEPVQAETGGPQGEGQVNDGSQFAGVLLCQRHPYTAADPGFVAPGKRRNGPIKCSGRLPEAVVRFPVEPSREIPAYSIPHFFIFSATFAVMSVPFVE